MAASDRPWRRPWRNSEPIELETVAYIDWCSTTGVFTPKLVTSDHQKSKAPIIINNGSNHWSHNQAGTGTTDRPIQTPWTRGLGEGSVQGAMGADGTLGREC